MGRRGSSWVHDENEGKRVIWIFMVDEAKEKRLGGGRGREHVRQGKD